MIDPLSERKFEGQEKIRKNWHILNMLKANSKRMVDSHCTRKKRNTEYVGNFLLLLYVCKKSETFSQKNLF